MPLGWIDFSKNERNKVLSVLDLLSESGTLDELGIAPVRDGFANLFFPGTSTIQTRAKYFLIVPYALKDLEYSNETNPNRMMRSFDETERRCGEILVGGQDSDGIIGKRSLAQGKWVKRTPADIYWAGLRYYGIFTGGTVSLTEYIHALSRLKNQKATLRTLGNRNDTAEEGIADDKDAGDLFHMQFWKIPTYREKWIDELSIKLTTEEGHFLKNQMTKAYPDSMMAYILRNDLTEVFGCKSFQDLEPMIGTFPDQIQRDYYLANDFSAFLFVLRTIYNMIISEGKNEEANITWEKLKPDDIVGRFVKFVESVFGTSTLERNLDFIADAIGRKGSSRETLRDYFINSFYQDHCAVYSGNAGKRPIYWLFDSGKKNGFKCLIYMHRYQPDTIARIRTDYVHEQQSRYRTAIADLEQRMGGASTSERVKLNKQLTKLQAQAEETRVYEEKIHHLADQMIKIDLDDGVKHNYAIFKDVLAKIK